MGRQICNGKFKRTHFHSAQIRHDSNPDKHMLHRSIIPTHWQSQTLAMKSQGVASCLMWPVIARGVKCRPYRPRNPAVPYPTNFASAGRGCAARTCSRAGSRLCRLAVGSFIVDRARAGHSRGLLMLASKQEAPGPFVSRSWPLALAGKL